MSKPPRACQEMKDWLIEQNNVKPIPVCGAIWIKELGDKNEQ